MIADGVWARRQAVNHDAALPHGYRMLEAAGNLENLRIAAGRSAARYRGPVFMDSDVYKWLEAAGWELGRAPSEWLRSTAEATIDLVAAAQGADGYINSFYTVAEPGKRWTDFAHGHELYCAGHLIQAAVAFRRATGDDRLLTIAQRFADYLHSLFGPGRKVATPGHPEIEMALVELYRETGERRHLDLAAFFLEHRGHGWLGPGRYNSSASFQDRVPVREATTVEGHAVRALYLTTGATDLYLETGEAALLTALNRQWHDLVTAKLYITGGVGGRHLSEAFGQPYELPNDLAYCETCGALASVMWSWRMLLATGESRFGDLIERTLYNAVLSGVSLGGDRYFYVNPLANNGEPEHLSRGGCIRKDWHLVACCPPNVMRQVATFGHYIATRDGAGLQIHQYASARITADLGTGPAMVVRIETAYPWEGRVRFSVEQGPTTSRALSFRVRLSAHRPRVAERRRHRARSADGAAAHRGASLDRVDPRLRGDRARPPRLLPRAGRSSRDEDRRPRDRHHVAARIGVGLRSPRGHHGRPRLRVCGRHRAVEGSSLSPDRTRLVDGPPAHGAHGDPVLRVGEPGAGGDARLDSAQPGALRVAPGSHRAGLRGAPAGD